MEKKTFTEWLSFFDNIYRRKVYTVKGREIICYFMNEPIFDDSANLTQEDIKTNLN